MERLTFDGNFCDIAQCRELPCPYDNNCMQKQVWERLRAYEDTGISPKACLQAVEMEDLLADEYYSVNRMLELLKADKGGRLLVLPCKVGDTVLDLTFPEKPMLMKNIRPEIAYESKPGIIFHMGYSVFADIAAHGRIKSVSEETEKALEVRKDG